jgi:hypothetical protein
VTLVLVLCAFVIGGAFAILAARRRRTKDDHQPLAAAAAATAAAAPAPAENTIEEGAIPRWRRPSLRAARSASDRGPAGPTFQLAFGAEAVEGAERRLVRYRVVRMVDGPDEIRSQEVGQLEENDEVEVLGRYAGYVQVRTPVGTVGWVHRTTLGPPIGSEEPDEEVGPPQFDLEAAFDMHRARATPAPVPVLAAVPAGSAKPAKAAKQARVAKPAKARSTSPSPRGRKAEPSV